jgi:hypothetical protein
MRRMLREFSPRGGSAGAFSSGRANGWSYASNSLSFRQFHVSLWLGVVMLTYVFVLCKEFLYGGDHHDAEDHEPFVSPILAAQSQQKIFDSASRRDVESHMGRLDEIWDGTWHCC